jgi:hypothetical protein
LQSLLKDLKQAATSIKSAVEIDIIGTVKIVTPKAQSQAITTSRRWSLPKDQGGVPMQTYRAVARRHGLHHGPRVKSNFNGDLLEPIHKALVVPWEKVFSRRIPKLLAMLTKRAKKTVQEFHTRVCSKVPESDLEDVEILSEQLEMCMQALDNITQHADETVLDHARREGTRGLESGIKIGMIPVYNKCARVKGSYSSCLSLLSRTSADHNVVLGKGGYAEMRRLMDDHVERNHRSMFTKVLRVLNADSLGMAKSLEASLTQLFQGEIEKIEEEYASVFLGSDDDPDALEPEVQLLHSQVGKYLETGDEKFATLNLPKKPATNELPSGDGVAVDKDQHTSFVNSGAEDHLGDDNGLPDGIDDPIDDPYLNSGDDADNEPTHDDTGDSEMQY